MQPYSLVLDQYLRLPGAAIGDADFKQRFAKQVAADMLPGFVFDRMKVRAQMGSSMDPPGILPTLIETGYDAERLRHLFCRLFGSKIPQP